MLGSLAEYGFRGRVDIPVAVVLLALLLVPVSMAEESSSTTITLRSAVPSLETIEIGADSLLALVARDPEAADSEWREPIERLPTTLERDLPEGSRWRFSIEGDHHWMRETELEIVPGEALELEVWPAGWIRTQARMVDPEDALPDEVEVRFQKEVDEQGLAEFEAIDCPVADRRLHCKLPAGRLDLRFAVTDAVPIYLWDQALALRQTTDLPPLHFRKGASIIGWVAAERGPLTEKELAEVEVALAPGIIAQSAQERALERQSAMTRKVVPGPRGFFQVSGIDPGLYRIAADHPRFAAVRRGPVLVKPDAELELDLLELPRATSLEILASMPADPYSTPWAMELHRRGSDQVYLEKMAEARADENGLWRLDDVNPGEYFLYVYGSGRSLWFQGPLTLIPGDNSFEADVDFTRLEGLVTLEGEPLPGSRAHFRDEKTGRQLSYRVKEEGRFFGFLPLDVTWEVNIEHPEAGVSTTFEGVEVPAQEPDDRWPKIHLEIPETRLEGRVVDDGGQPVVGVNVEVDGRGGWAYRRTDEDGRFVFRGLRPASWTVLALGQEPPRRSQVETVTLAEEDEVEVPDLVLETNHRIVGQVVGTRGEAIAAARLVAKPRYRPGDPGPAVQTSDTIEFTDLEGRFEMTVPGRVDEYWLTLSPPGYAISHQSVRLPLEEPLTVFAEAEGGTLVVRYDDPPELFRDAKLGSLGGEYIYLKLLTQLLGEGPIGDFFGLESWRQQHGAVEMDHEFQRTYPQLAPGPYSACFGNGLLYTWAQGRPLPAEIEERHCDSGFLSAGGELVLTLPASAYEAEAARLRAQEAASAESR